SNLMTATERLALDNGSEHFNEPEQFNGPEHSNEQSDYSNSSPTPTPSKFNYNKKSTFKSRIPKLS
ncbi:44683_t:CDS:2, partial [Gigaspora margarita]